MLFQNKKYYIYNSSLIKAMCANSKSYYINIKHRAAPHNNMILVVIFVSFNPATFISYAH